jgi:glutathione S-transferase
MLELYHYWSSVCSVKARIALAEKGLEWKSYHTDIFAGDQLTPEYLAMNPLAVVPTLVHDGRPIIESTVIIEYLDEVFPQPPLTPKDPYDRALMRIFIKGSGDELLQSIGMVSLDRYIGPKLAQRYKGHEAELEAFIRRKPNQAGHATQLRAVRQGLSKEEVAGAYARVDAALDRMEKMLSARGPWLIGDYSLADIAVAPHIHRLERLGEAGRWEKKRPAVAKWWERMSARPGFKTAVGFPPPDGKGYEEVGLASAPGTT